MESAELLRDKNPERADGSLYDAVRMALTAVLENQGLRPTSRGGHIASYTTVAAQLDRPMGAVLRPFDRMRRTRNRSEYPSFTTPDVTAGNITADLAAAEAIIKTCEGVLDEMSPHESRGNRRQRLRRRSASLDLRGTRIGVRNESLQERTVFGDDLKRQCHGAMNVASAGLDSATWARRAREWRASRMLVREDTDALASVGVEPRCAPTLGPSAGEPHWG